ncbi:MAG: PepSY-like domain-containing protein [Muribaculaceae bacterium]|nr:PepSY-like domain-containing protein [Muribaculaceae bacterium]
MKYFKIMILAFAAIVLCSLPAQAFIDKYSVNRSDLPEKAQTFLNEHFPKAKVSMVKTDRHLLKKADYDVKLTNGTKIEFSSKGDWTSVDCNKREVPSALILKKIRTYVKKNFPDAIVVKVDKKSLNFEIELNNGVELKFDRLGTFKSMKTDD